MTLAVKAQGSNHWTTRELPASLSYIFNFFFFQFKSHLHWSRVLPAPSTPTRNLLGRSHASQPSPSPACTPTLVHSPKGELPLPAPLSFPSSRSPERMLPQLCAVVSLYWTNAQGPGAADEELCSLSVTGHLNLLTPYSVPPAIIVPPSKNSCFTDRWW